MSSRGSGSVIRRIVLERATRPLLARLLRPHASFFSGAGVDLNALAASSQDDKTFPRRIYALLNDAAAPLPPAALLDTLSALDDLASGSAELVRLDTERVLPRGHGPEELALVALLSAPELAAQARHAAARDAEHKFVEYAPAVAPGPVSFDDKTIAAIRAHLAEAFDAIDHTRYCEVVVDVRNAYVDIEIEHGARPRTREIINPESLATSQTTDVTARRSRGRYHRATGRLAMRAASEALKNLLRRSFGEALFRDAEFFRAGGLYDLAPFRDLESALSTEGVAGLVAIELRGLVVDAEHHFQEFGSSSIDIREKAGAAIALALQSGTPSAVKLFLHIDGAKKKRVKVEIAANGKHNSVEYPRNDPVVLAIVEAYLRARRILSEPDAAASSAPEAAE